MRAGLPAVVCGAPIGAEGAVVKKGVVWVWGGGGNEEGDGGLSGFLN